MATEIAYRIERLRAEAGRERLAAARRGGCASAIGHALMAPGAGVHGPRWPETADPAAGRRPDNPDQRRARHGRPGPDGSGRVAFRQVTGAPAGTAGVRSAGRRGPRRRASPVATAATAIRSARLRSARRAAASSTRSSAPRRPKLRTPGHPEGGAEAQARLEEARGAACQRQRHEPAGRGRRA